jgi:hypothetical protein
MGKNGIVREVILIDNRVPFIDRSLRLLLSRMFPTVQVMNADFMGMNDYCHGRESES